MSRLRQGRFANLPLRPWMVRLGFALFPPLLGAHIHLEELSSDFRYARLTMPLWISNRTLWGAHFGGSLFALTDAILPVLLKQNLGADYVVWDKAATIEFMQPARSRVWCEFRVDEALLARIRAETSATGKSEPLLALRVYDRQNQTVAVVDKKIYVRRRDVDST
ncbi:MAG: DUF4442 domain-containing protein [Sterolibacterium sp.]|nr:DUF4442 domain-containing protein [Sterolibacterium sp.]